MNLVKHDNLPVSSPILTLFHFILTETEEYRRIEKGKEKMQETLMKLKILSGHACVKMIRIANGKKIKQRLASAILKP